MDKRIFAEHMAILCESFEKPCTDSLLKLYWLDLQNMTDAQFIGACERLRRGEGRDPKSLAFMPRAGEIMQAIGGSSKSNAQDAWATIYGMIGQLDPTTGKQYHANNPPLLQDQKARRALQVIGGFAAVCHTPIEDQQWLQKRFVEQYEAADSAFARDDVERIGRDDAKGLLQKISMGVPREH